MNFPSEWHRQAPWPAFAVRYDSGGAFQRKGGGSRSCARPQPKAPTWKSDEMCCLIFRPPVDGLATAPGLVGCDETTRVLHEPGTSRVDGTSAEELHQGLP